MGCLVMKYHQQYILPMISSFLNERGADVDVGRPWPVTFQTPQPPKLSNRQMLLSLGPGKPCSAKHNQPRIRMILAHLLAHHVLYFGYKETGSAGGSEQEAAYRHSHHEYGIRTSSLMFPIGSVKSHSMPARSLLPSLCAHICG